MVVVSTAFTPEGVGWSRLARVWGGVAPQFSFGSSRAPPLFDRAAWSMTYLLIYEHKYIHTQQIDFKILQYPRHREEPLILSTRVDYKPGEIKYPGTSWPHYNLCPHILRPVSSNRLLWLLCKMITMRRASEASVFFLGFLRKKSLFITSRTSIGCQK